jgi:hypothetical protein
MKNIRQNLFFAFAYNVIGVPIAAGVLFPIYRIALVADDRECGDDIQLGVCDRERVAVEMPAVIDHRRDAETRRKPK